MKNIITTIIILAALMFFSGLQAQTFEIRIQENDYGYLAVQMRETSGTGTPTTSTDIADISFEIRWLATLSTDVEVICSSNDYNLADALGSKQTSGSYDFRLFQATNTPFNPPSNWTQNQWETLATFKATSGSGSGDFEISPDGFGGYDLNWNQDGTDYTQTINGSASAYSYPTLVYDFVWKGGGTGPGADPSRWNQTNNWEDECGGATPTGFWPYQTTENVLIPDVSSGSNSYPDNFSVSSGYAYTCNNILIADGGQVTVPDLSSGNTGGSTYFDINGNLIVNGALNLPSLGYATVSGSTTINSANGIIVEAEATGVGSFIDNGTITYGASGSAKVQTYLSNSAGAGNFDIHLVGPTVDQISGGTDGALLGAFNLVNGNTYAYEWDESQNFDAGWVNIFNTSHTVYVGSGIGLSTDDGSTNTLEMTGNLFTGNISSPSLTFSNNHNELLSNPYPSAIDFDGLASDNSTVVQNKYWIWDPDANDYVERAAGSGGSQYIQIGQGFFVETKQAGTFDFTNARRAHSNSTFRNTLDNLLTVRAVGGMENYSDEIVIRFDEEATSGYDIEIEALKWTSQNSDATQISTIADDNSILAINVLPVESLNTGMVSVPMNFSCGYNTDYELTFTDIETFEYGTEIWLEDKLIGEDWININENPVYLFSANSNDPDDRFVIHFFGPTGIDNGDVFNNGIDIYSSGQFAFVRNKHAENIKKVNIFTLGGKLLSEYRNPDLIINKYRVNDEIGYFIVRVVTDKNVYTKKVLITK